MCADAPDTSGVNDAAVQNAAIGARQQDLAEKSYADSQARLKEYEPLFKQIIQGAADQSTKAADQSEEQWNQWRTLFKPAEEKLVTQAMEYDTPERRAAEAAQASAGVESAAAAQQQQTLRTLASRGVDTTSGNAVAALGLGGALTAAQKAAAGNAASKAVEQQGTALLDNAAKFGRGMTSTGIETSRLSTQQGQAATGTVAQQQGVASQGAATAGSLFGQAANSNSSAGNLFLGAAQAQANANAGTMAGLAGLGNMAGNLIALSSKSAKRTLGDIKPAQPREESSEDIGGPTLRAINGLENGVWRYREDAGTGDDATHVGPYAEDTQAALGDKVAPGGKVIDMTEMMQANAQAIAELAQELDAIHEELAALESSAAA